MLKLRPNNTNNSLGNIVSYLRKGKRVLTFLLCFSLIFENLFFIPLVGAQAVPLDDGLDNIEKISENTYLINIAPPNAAGISYNVLEESKNTKNKNPLNQDEKKNRKLIINNSPKRTVDIWNTEINGNPRLEEGQAANIIVFQLPQKSSGQLDIFGQIELLGGSEELIFIAKKQNLELLNIFEINRITLIAGGSLSLEQAFANGGPQTLGDIGSKYDSGRLTIRNSLVAEDLYGLNIFGDNLEIFGTIFLRNCQVNISAADGQLCRRISGLYERTTPLQRGLLDLSAANIFSNVLNISYATSLKIHDNSSIVIGDKLTITGEKQSAKLFSMDTGTLVRSKNTADLILPGGLSIKNNSTLIVNDKLSLNSNGGIGLGNKSTISAAEASISSAELTMNSASILGQKSMHLKTDGSVLLQNESILSLQNRDGTMTLLLNRGNLKNEGASLISSNGSLKITIKNGDLNNSDLYLQTGALYSKVSQPRDAPRRESSVIESWEEIKSDKYSTPSKIITRDKLTLNITGDIYNRGSHILSENGLIEIRAHNLVNERNYFFVDRTFNVCRTWTEESCRRGENRNFFSAAGFIAVAWMNPNLHWNKKCRYSEQVERTTELSKGEIIYSNSPAIIFGTNIIAKLTGNFYLDHRREVPVKYTATGRVESMVGAKNWLQMEMAYADIRGYVFAMSGMPILRASKDIKMLGGQIIFGKPGAYVEANVLEVNPLVYRREIHRPNYYIFNFSEITAPSGFLQLNYFADDSGAVSEVPDGVDSSYANQGLKIKATNARADNTKNGGLGFYDKNSKTNLLDKIQELEYKKLVLKAQYLDIEGSQIYTKGTLKLVAGSIKVGAEKIENTQQTANSRSESRTESVYNLLTTIRAKNLELKSPGETVEFNGVDLVVTDGTVLDVKTLLITSAKDSVYNYIKNTPIRSEENKFLFFKKGYIIGVQTIEKTEEKIEKSLDENVKGSQVDFGKLSGNANAIHGVGSEISFREADKGLLNIIILESAEEKHYADVENKETTTTDTLGIGHVFIDAVKSASKFNKLREQLVAAHKEIKRLETREKNGTASHEAVQEAQLRFVTLISDFSEALIGMGAPLGIAATELATNLGLLGFKIDGSHNVEKKYENFYIRNTVQKQSILNLALSNIVLEQIDLLGGKIYLDKDSTIKAKTINIASRSSNKYKEHRSDSRTLSGGFSANINPLINPQIFFEGSYDPKEDFSYAEDDEESGIYHRETTLPNANGENGEGEYEDEDGEKTCARENIIVDHLNMIGRSVIDVKNMSVKNITYRSTENKFYSGTNGLSVSAGANYGFSFNRPTLNGIPLQINRHKNKKKGSLNQPTITAETKLSGPETDINRDRTKTYLEGEDYIESQLDFSINLKPPFFGKSWEEIKNDFLGVPENILKMAEALYNNPATRAIYNSFREQSEEKQFQENNLPATERDITLGLLDHLREQLALGLGITSLADRVPDLKNIMDKSLGEKRSILLNILERIAQNKGKKLDVKIINDFREASALCYDEGDSRTIVINFARINDPLELIAALYHESQDRERHHYNENTANRLGQQAARLFEINYGKQSQYLIDPNMEVDSDAFDIFNRRAEENIKINGERYRKYIEDQILLGDGLTINRMGEGFLDMALQSSSPVLLLSATEIAELGLSIVTPVAIVVGVGAGLYLIYQGGRVIKRKLDERALNRVIDERTIVEQLKLNAMTADRSEIMAALGATANDVDILMPIFLMIKNREIKEEAAWDSYLGVTGSTVDEIFKLHDDAEISTRSEIEEGEAEAKTATWATTEETSGEGKCDKCKLTDRIKDLWGDAKYKYKVATSIKEEFDHISRREELTNAPISAEVAQKNAQEKDEFHRGAHEERIAGRSVVEGKTRTFLRRNEGDGELCKHTWTEGSLVAKGRTFDGVFEYITNERGVVIHEVFNKKYCRETKKIYN
ncbi:MAG: hypothetical protein LBI70_02405 [Rickettsiales bacterium]|jgi:hypothetical protein|nr:hypothetical protein [Rickettsiales bacterium]